MCAMGRLKRTSRREMLNITLRDFQLYGTLCRYQLVGIGASSESDKFEWRAPRSVLSLNKSTEVADPLTALSLGASSLGNPVRIL